MPKCRKAKKRRVGSVFHIYCEGEKTEPNYIDYYIKNHCQDFRAFQLTRVKLKEVLQVAKTNKTDPKSLVELAIAEKCKTPIGDVFWCVYDRESEAERSERSHLEAACLASRHGISIALSNVCFEVWLLLHKQDTCAAYGSYDDLARHSRLKTHYPHYEKGERRSYSADEIKRARINALKMNQQTQKNSGTTAACKLNPYTDFYMLLDSIDDFFRRNCADRGR